MGESFGWRMEGLVSWLVTVLVALILVKLSLLWYDLLQEDAKLSAIPTAPGGVPLLGHIFSMISQPPWDTLSGWVLKYGPIVRLNLFGKQIVAVNDRDMLKQVLQQKFHEYQKDKFTYAPFRCLLGTGLVTSEGKLWKDQRGFIAPAFRVDILQDTAEITCRATERLCEKLEKIRGTNEEIQMAEEFRKLTLQVIGEAVLSLSPEESDRVFPELYLPIVEEANRRTWYPFRAYLPLPATFAHSRAIRQMNEYITALIQKRKKLFDQGERCNDILDRILENVQEWNSDSVRQLRDEIKTFLFAGHETSSAMMTWTMYELNRNPDYLKRVVEEATEVFGTDGSSAPFEKIKDGLTFTQAALKESLRKYSVVPVVTRQLATDDNLCGYYIPQGTIVVVPIQAVHNDPKNWPEPQEYRPDRFLENVDPFSFLGFIAGPRNCIGQFFALMETKIVLGLILKRFKFTIPPHNKGVKHRSQIPLCPVDNMPLIVQ